MAVAIPPFWLHLAYSNNAKVMSLASELTNANLAFGFVSGPHRGVSADQREFQAARAIAPTIFDPHGHYLDREGDHDTKTRAREYPFLSHSNGVPTTPAQYRAWMQSCIDIQEDPNLAGNGAPPEFFVTPSRVLKLSPNLNTLYNQLNAAECIPVQAGEKWIGLSLAREFVLDSGFRTALLNQLVGAADVGIDGIVLRFFCQEQPPFSGNQFLAGMRDIVSTLAAVELPILMANSGTLGWLATGWGAKAFAAGWSRGSWSSREPAPMRRPNDPPEYYFEKQLLREIPWRVHLRLTRQTGYTPCACSHCAAMGATWDEDSARNHHLFAGAEAANAIIARAPAARPAAIRRELNSAIAFRDSLSTQLRADCAAGFLNDWVTAV